MPDTLPRSVGIHDGPFHADEVTAVALLLLTDRVDRDRIHRSRDPEVLDECEYVCDVGGTYDPAQKRFDHHQVDYRGGLSSAGMVLEFLWREGALEKEEYHFLRENLMDGVDLHDNGRIQPIPGVMTFSVVVANFMPVSYDATPSEIEEGFWAALHFVRGHLERMLGRHRYGVECRQQVAEAMKGGAEILIFDKKIPWLESFFALGGEGHPAKLVVMPANPHWKLRGIPPNMAERMSVRVPMPEKWAGLLEGDLGKVCPIKGAVFCHKGRFVSVWETKEAALEAARRILNGDRF
ncbi:MAG: MYG1 family protein [Parachlamydiales bacterium]